MGDRTSVEVRLLGNLIVRVAVGVNGLVELLIRHERVDELVVGVEQAVEPLFVLNVVNLTSHIPQVCSQYTSILFTCPVGEKKTYITQRAPSQLLARLEALHGRRVGRDALLFTVDALQGVEQIGARSRRVGNDRRHLLLFRVQVKRAFLAAASFAPARRLFVRGVFAAAAKGRQETSAAGR